MKKHERMLVEAVKNFLDVGENLAVPEQPEDQNTEHSLQYLQEYINNLFSVKTADLSHHTGIHAAFSKVHSYKYITDPTFKIAMDKDMKSQGIPADERSEALAAVDKVIADVKKDGHEDERDAGWNPNLDEIIKVTSNQ